MVDESELSTLNRKLTVFYLCLISATFMSSTSPRIHCIWQLFFPSKELLNLWVVDIESIVLGDNKYQCC